jgi:hypothetical protein
MNAIVDLPIILAILGLILLGIAATSFGTDSRPGFGRDGAQR